MFYKKYFFVYTFWDSNRASDKMLQYLETNRLLEEQKERNSDASLVRQGRKFISDFVSTAEINSLYREWVIFASEGIISSKTDEQFNEFLAATGVFGLPEAMPPDASYVMKSKIVWQVFRLTLRCCLRVERYYQLHYGRSPGPISEFIKKNYNHRNMVDLIEETLSEKGIEAMFGPESAPYFIAKAKRFIEIGETYPTHLNDNAEERRMQIRCATALRLCIAAVNFRMTVSAGKIWIEDYCRILRTAERRVEKLMAQGVLIDMRYPNHPGTIADIMPTIRRFIEQTNAEKTNKENYQPGFRF